LTQQGGPFDETICSPWISHDNGLQLLAGRRAEQYTACETAYRNAQRITECLIMKFDWKPSDASLAGDSYGVWMTGRGRNPLSWIDPPKNLEAELKSILTDFSLGEEAYFAENVRYTADARSISWVADLDSTYDLRIVLGPYTQSWTGILERKGLRCVIHVGAGTYAPATTELVPACEEISKRP